jgi:hypothetical protein
MDFIDKARVRVEISRSVCDYFDVYYDGVYAGAVIKEKDGRYLATVALPKDKGGSLKDCGRADSLELAACRAAAASITPIQRARPRPIAEDQPSL